MGPAFPQLTLFYQLNKPEPVEPQATLEERIRLRGDVATFTTQLTATQSMEVFPEQPLKHHVYFLVQRPARSEPITVVSFDHG